MGNFNRRECFIRIKALAEAVDECLLNGSEKSIGNAVLLNELLLQLCEEYENAES